MTAVILALGLLLVAVLVPLFVIRWRNPDVAPHRITPPARRILFPFIGSSISRPTLDAALRLARAEGATLVPAYVITVPFDLDLQAPLTERCEDAMSLLELIEQRAARLKVPVDSRVEVGRTARHALHELLEGERFDRIVVPAATHHSDGFAGTDIAWLLEHAPGEIVVLRPETSESGRNGDEGKSGHSARERMASAPPQASAPEPVGSANGRAARSVS
jgi:nucleotide-binding universal stress UspA family protein